MENVIILKNSATKGKVPDAKKLELGEIAINTTDGLLYTKRTQNKTSDVISFGSNINFTQRVENISKQGEISLDCLNSQVKVLEIIGHSSIKLTNPPQSGNLVKVRLFIKTTGAFLVFWENTILWKNSQIPSISENWSIIELETFDGGQTFFGTMVGSNYKEL